ncbi:MAG: hypothetical protein K2W82_10370 [Candidatus Obscuribacterales bacterium]|nr:hypothetical protein [Candidatus Obscuribacterales bacterium]
MSFSLFQAKIPYEDARPYLRYFTPYDAQFPEAWVNTAVNNLAVGDLIFVLDPILSAASQTHVLGVAETDKFRVGLLLLVFAIESGAHQCLVVGSEDYEALSVEELFSARAEAAQKKGAGFYYLLARPLESLSVAQQDDLAEMQKWTSSGKRNQFHRGVAEPVFAFLSKLDVSIDVIFAQQPVDIKSLGYFLFTKNQPSASSRIPDLSKKFYPVKAGEEIGTVPTSPAAEARIEEPAFDVDLQSLSPPPPGWMPPPPSKKNSFFESPMDGTSDISTLGLAKEIASIVDNLKDAVHSPEQEQNNFDLNSAFGPPIVEEPAVEEPVVEELQMSFFSDPPLPEAVPPREEDIVQAPSQPFQISPQSFFETQDQGIFAGDDSPETISLLSGLSDAIQSWASDSESEIEPIVNKATVPPEAMPEISIAKSYEPPKEIFEEVLLKPDESFIEPVSMGFEPAILPAETALETKVDTFIIEERPSQTYGDSETLIAVARQGYGSGVAILIDKLEQQALLATIKLEEKLTEVELDLKAYLNTHCDELHAKSAASMQNVVALKQTLYSSLFDALDSLKSRLAEAIKSGDSVAATFLRDAEQALVQQAEQSEALITRQMDEMKFELATHSSSILDKLTARHELAMRDLNDILRGVEERAKKISEHNLVLLENDFNKIVTSLEKLKETGSQNLAAAFAHFEAMLSASQEKNLNTLENLADSLVDEYELKSGIGQKILYRVAATLEAETVTPVLEAGKHTFDTVSRELKENIARQIVQESDKFRNSLTGVSTSFLDEIKKGLYTIDEIRLGVTNIREDELNKLVDSMWLFIEEKRNDVKKQAEYIRNEVAQIDKNIDQLNHTSETSCSKDLAEMEITSLGKLRSLGLLIQSETTSAIEMRLLKIEKEKGQALQEALISSMEEQSFAAKKSAQSDLEKVKAAVKKAFAEIQSAQDACSQ